MKLDIFARRQLVGSDAIILCAAAMHIYEAAVIAFSSSADGTIAINALLSVFKWHLLAAIILLSSCAAAMMGQWISPISPHTRLMLLLPQQTMLLITSLGALLAVVSGHYADGVSRSFFFLSCDQFPRLIAPILYTVAVLARIKQK